MYAILDPKKTTGFFLVRQGWFCPEYDLTDNVNDYGKLTYHRLSRRKATAATATGTWIFKRGELLSRSTVVTDENDAVIGELTRDWFSRKTKLTLQTGFMAEFYRTSFFSREYVWDSAGYGKVMHIKSNPFSLTSLIILDQSKTPAALIPLLIFLGSYLITLSRRRKARH